MRRPTKKPAGWKGTAGEPATKDQISNLKRLKTKLLMDDDVYREVVARFGQGVTSSKELTRAEASAMISELMWKAGETEQKTTYRFATSSRKTKVIADAKAMNPAEVKTAIAGLLAKHGVKPVKEPPVTSKGNVIALATPKQRALIGHLIQEVDWYAHGSYEAWLTKIMGLEEVKTKEDAARVIEGLKGLKAHGHAKKTSA